MKCSIEYNMIRGPKLGSACKAKAEEVNLTRGAESTEQRTQIVGSRRSGVVTTY